jgi:hypothetical protein
LRIGGLLFLADGFSQAIDQDAKANAPDGSNLSQGGDLGHGTTKYWIFQGLKGGRQAHEDGF